MRRCFTAGIRCHHHKERAHGIASSGAAPTPSRPTAARRLAKASSSAETIFVIEIVNSSAPKYIAHLY